MNWSATKSSDQRSFGSCGMLIGARVSQGPLASVSSTDHEALLTIKPEQPLVVHTEALLLQKYMQAPVAEPPALMSQRPQPSPQLGVV
jgi:hypothetical protein